jgi:glycosyltransferase involved in cell wall biosynthesis
MSQLNRFKLIFSVITVTKNSATTIKDCVSSVNAQIGVRFEHIIKDANSSDATREIAKSINPAIELITCKDDGIYDAMNQGFMHAKGDIVSFLNSDDIYIDNQVLNKIALLFEKTNCDFVYGDILMVNKGGNVVRNWRSGPDLAFTIKSGQIPHPGLFIRRSILSNIAGPFDAKYKIAGDLKQQLILVNRLKAHGQYLSEPLVIMAIGGESTKNIGSYILGWRESYQAWREVGGSYALLFVIRKIISKIKDLKI